MVDKGIAEERLRSNWVWWAFRQAYQSRAGEAGGMEAPAAEGVPEEDLRRLRVLMPDLSEPMIRRLVTVVPRDDDEASEREGESGNGDWTGRIPQSRSCSDWLRNGVPTWGSDDEEHMPPWCGPGGAPPWVELSRSAWWLAMAARWQAGWRYA